MYGVVVRNSLRNLSNPGHNLCPRNYYLRINNSGIINVHSQTGEPFLMLNNLQYEKLKPFKNIIIKISEGRGNTSNQSIKFLCNEVWVELKHPPKCLYCSNEVFELFQNIKDEINFYEEKYGKGED